jgi:cell division transport system ATP-binding protein
MHQIEFKGVTKEYDNFKAVDGISFHVDKGEFVFIIGPSGAGKSTLIKMLIREEKPDYGDVLFNEKSIVEMDPKFLPELRRKIGVVFQDFKVLKSKTVFENVSVALEVVDSEKHVINEVVPNVLNLVGLQNKSDQFPTKLSGGEKQRLAIARALAHEPDVLVADEPTGMIDPKSADEVMDVLTKINSLGTTVIMATHNHTLVDKFKKRVIKIDDGKLISDKEGGIYDDES